MCDRCEEIDLQIVIFKRMSARADDELALALFAEAIADIEAEKAALHPEQHPARGED